MFRPTTDLLSDVWHRSSALFTASSIAVCVFAFALYIYNNDFPLNIQLDEGRKVQQVVEGTQNFQHPILMLQLARVGTFLSDLSEPVQIVALGRTLNALAILFSLTTYFLMARQVLSRNLALLTIAALATTPVVVVHAHYFKEDALLVATQGLLFYSLYRFNPTSLKSLVLLGGAVGITMASKYAALVAVLIVLIDIASNARHGILRTRVVIVVVVSIIGSATFTAINYPILFNHLNFLNGVYHEMDHIQTGHLIKRSGFQTFFVHHLTNSILPGFTWPLGIIVIVGYALACLNWSRLPRIIKTLLIYCLVYYVVIELSPSKPFDGGVRYVLPLAPILAIAATIGIKYSLDLIPRQAVLLVTTLASASITWSVISSIGLVSNMSTENDTRVAAARWLENHDGTLVYDYPFPKNYEPDNGEFAWLGLDIPDLSELHNYKYIVSHKRVYEMIMYGSRIENQDPRFYRSKEIYTQFWNNDVPYVEFSVIFGDYAYVAPTIRIFQTEYLARQ